MDGRSISPTIDAYLQFTMRACFALTQRIPPNKKPTRTTFVVRVGSSDF
jgi:hypothetical protein